MSNNQNTSQLNEAKNTTNTDEESGIETNSSNNNDITVSVGSTVSGPSYSQYNQSSVDDLEMETRSINNEGLDDSNASQSTFSSCFSESSSYGSVISQVSHLSNVSNVSSTSIYNKLTRNVQSYLQATTSARTMVRSINSVALKGAKRLSTTKTKSIDRCKYETNNQMLQKMMDKYDEMPVMPVYSDLKSIDRRIGFSRANVKKLKTLFTEFDCYLTTIYMPTDDVFNSHVNKFNVFKNLYQPHHKNANMLYNIAPKSSQDQALKTPTNSDTKHTVKQSPEEFFLCPLCSHCFNEPVTLVCGCTYCKGCLREYNKLKRKNNLNAKKRLHLIDQTGDDDAAEKSKLNTLLPDYLNSMENPSRTTHDIAEHECYNCSNTHRFNGSPELKVNTLISLVVEKLWLTNVNVQKLRNDLRNYVVFDLEHHADFKLEKYEYLFKQAYEKDQTNHLILVDLFLINHFAGYFETSNKYAEQIITTKPKWILGHYLKSISNEILENYNEVRSSLITCLELDPSLEHFRVKLKNIEDYLSLIEQASSSGTSSGLTRFGLLQKSKHKSVVDLTKANYSPRRLSLKKKLMKMKNLDVEFEKISYDKTGELLEKSTIRKNESIRFNSLKKSDLDLMSGFSDSNVNIEGSPATKTKNVWGFTQPLGDTKKTDKKYLNQSSNPDITYKVTPVESLSMEDSAEVLSIQSEPIRSESIDSLNVIDMTVTKESDCFRISIDSSLIKITDVECCLCCRILYKPVTTPCGHSYCNSCLDRSLDHQDKCPLCKSSLDEYLAERRQFTTSFIEKLIKTVFDSEYDERETQYEEELKELTSEENASICVPIFVCTLTFPFAPCPLHIYEPRYRLMLRRAIESGSKQFGMCMYSDRTPYRFTEYGCMLEIQNYQFTRDGRAIVATVGGRRFKVVSTSMRDGYYVAKVSWVTDERVENEERKTELQQLHDEVYQLSARWYSYIPELQKKKIRGIYGISQMPVPDADIQANDNGPLWHWFLVNILPLDNDFQYRFLAKNSLNERLRQIKRIVLVLLNPLQRTGFLGSDTYINNHQSTMEIGDTQRNRISSSQSESNIPRGSQMPSQGSMELTSSELSLRESNSREDPNSHENSNSREDSNSDVNFDSISQSNSNNRDGEILGSE